MTEQDFRQLDIDEVNRTLQKAKSKFELLAYLKDGDGDSKVSRTAEFLWELHFAIKQLLIPGEVFCRDGTIHPGYAISKLNYAKNILDTTISYFEDLLQQEMSKEEICDEPTDESPGSE